MEATTVVVQEVSMLDPPKTVAVVVVHQTLELVVLDWRIGLSLPAVAPVAAEMELPE